MVRPLRKLHSLLIVGLLVTGLSVSAVALWLWPEDAPSPVLALPLRIVSGEDGSKLAADLIPPQSGLVELPLTISGRASIGPKGMLQQEWAGFHVEARFHGTAISIRFEDGINRWRILLNNGKAGRVEVSRPGMNDLRISGLNPGDYLVRVEKISESFEPASFGGILVDPEGNQLAAPPLLSELIEFIGDSDTVGLGNTARTRDCSGEEIYSATDTTVSFGPQVAVRIGADYRLLARSGIGLVRNAGGDSPGDTMVHSYLRSLPSEPAAKRLQERSASIVVTGLGSNDFGTNFAQGEPWESAEEVSADFGVALQAFVRDRAQENPGALQVLLAFGEYGNPLLRPYRDAEVALRENGIDVILVVLPKLGRKACAWHPSLDDHKLIADRLVAAITSARSPKER